MNGEKHPRLGHMVVYSIYNVKNRDIKYTKNCCMEYLAIYAKGAICVVFVNSVFLYQNIYVRAIFHTHISL